MLRAILEKHRIGKKPERREIVMEFAKEAERLIKTDTEKAYQQLENASTLYHDLLYGYDLVIDKDFQKINLKILKRMIDDF